MLTANRLRNRRQRIVDNHRAVLLRIGFVEPLMGAVFTELEPRIADGSLANFLRNRGASTSEVDAILATHNER